MTISSTIVDFLKLIAFFSVNNTPELKLLRADEHLAPDLTLATAMAQELESALAMVTALATALAAVPLLELVQRHDSPHSNPKDRLPQGIAQRDVSYHLAGYPWQVSVY